MKMLPHWVQCLRTPTVRPLRGFRTARFSLLYAHLNKDGTVGGVAARAGLRQVAQLTGAKIVVLASPNASDAIQNSATLPGPKSANLVFTLNRNGNHFSRFFRELFDKMQKGKSLLGVWVELVSQHSSAKPAFSPSTVRQYCRSWRSTVS